MTIKFKKIKNNEKFFYCWNQEYKNSLLNIEFEITHQEHLKIFLDWKIFGTFQLDFQNWITNSKDEILRDINFEIYSMVLEKLKEIYFYDESYKIHIPTEYIKSIKKFDEDFVENIFYEISYLESSFEFICVSVSELWKGWNKKFKNILLEKFLFNPTENFLIPIGLENFSIFEDYLNENNGTYQKNWVVFFVETHKVIYNTKTAIAN